MMSSRINHSDDEIVDDEPIVPNVDVHDVLLGTITWDQYYASHAA